MSNRFYTPNSQHFLNPVTGAPLAGGKLFFFASGTSTPLSTFSDRALSVANANPVILDSNGFSGNVFLQNLAYNVTLKDANDVVIWSADPVYTSDFSTFAQVPGYPGNPNGNVAGTQATGGPMGTPASMIYDTVGNILYVCTTTGNATTAVWTAINSGNTSPVTTVPQGYLTPTSGVPIISSDVISQSSLVYTPYKGSSCPIYNGSIFTNLPFVEQLLTLVSQHLANTIYDVFMFSNNGVLTLCTGPAWANSGAGVGDRGTGGSTTQLQMISGILVNAVTMAGRNGATVFSSIGANLATYLGTIFIDAVAGQITCHRTSGQNRKWAIWNAYNREALYLKSSDPGSFGNANVAFAPLNSNAANKLTTLAGLPEVMDMYAEVTITASGGVVSVANGVGINSTTIVSGYAGQLTLDNTADIGFVHARVVMPPPVIGINVMTHLFHTDGAGATTTGSENGNVVGANWRG